MSCIHTRTHTHKVCGKVAHSVKCVLCKLEDLSLDPEHPWHENQLGLKEQEDPASGKDSVLKHKVETD